MRPLPLRERKRLLRDALRLAARSASPRIATEDGEGFFREACPKGWEGLIAKRADSPYPAAPARATG